MWEFKGFFFIDYFKVIIATITTFSNCYLCSSDFFHNERLQQQTKVIKERLIVSKWDAIFAHVQ